MNPVSLPEAPGAKAARVCGILALLFSVTCIGIPAGIVLGIVALVKNSRARRLEREDPSSYRRSSPAGLVLGIVGLVASVIMVPFAGIFSAIAIPIFIQKREQAQETRCKIALKHQLGALQMEYLRLAPTGLDHAAMIQSLQRHLAESKARNVYDPAQPGNRSEVAIVDGTAEDEMQYLIEPMAEVKGQLVFAISFPPNPDHPGYLAGAVRTGNLQNPVLCEVVELR
jgi:hypothetical protein